MMINMDMISISLQTIVRILSVFTLMGIHEFGHWIVAEYFNHDPYITIYNKSIAIKYGKTIDLEKPNQREYNRFTFESRLISFGSVICIPFAYYFIDYFIMDNQIPIISSMMFCYSCYELISPREPDWSREFEELKKE